MDPSLDARGAVAVSFGKKPFDWMTDTQWQMLLVRDWDKNPHLVYYWDPFPDRERCATEAFSTTCAVHIEDCGGWWLSSGHGSVRGRALGSISVCFFFTFL